MIMKKSFITLWDLSSEEIWSLVRRAVDLKTDKDAGQCPLIGKSIGLLFEKPSTRTRVSFDVGIYQLGGNPIYMNTSDLQLGRGESVPDTARTLSRYLDGIVMRTFAHSTIEEFAASATIPLVNGLSDLHHPCQTLADLMTMLEKKGRIKGLKVAYIGDGNNVCNSLIEAASLMEFDLTVACPEGFEPAPGILAKARQAAKSEIIVLGNPREAAGMADVVYTDVWVSMGEERQANDKRKKLADYQINSSLLSCSREDVIVLHCLPAHRGEEITDAVIDGPHSVVFDQAENRLHAQKALIELLMAEH
jgi:ornithine carbamoyltransferase